jgi:glyoxylase-like metal-dependent hydrolase (beta-lactamase superfamily II)
MPKVNLVGPLFLITPDDSKSFPYSTSLFVDDEVKGLVDTGVNSSQLKKLAKETDIKILINSHYHIDHVRGNWIFPNASLYAPTEDAPAINSFEKFLEMTGFKKNPELLAYFEKRKKDFFDVREKVKVKVRFRDNYEFDFGETVLKVIHAPGHTPGHACFFEPKNKVLFTTDIDLTPFGPWYGNVASDVEDFMNSIEMLHHLRPKIVVTSHSGPFEGKTKIDLLFEKYIDVIYQREEKILDLLKTERSVDELVGKGVIYKKMNEPVNMYRFFETMMLEKHMGRLTRLGDVEQVENGRYKAVP